MLNQKFVKMPKNREICCDFMKKMALPQNAEIGRNCMDLGAAADPCNFVQFRHFESKKIALRAIFWPIFS